MPNPALPIVKGVPSFPRTDLALPVSKGRLKIGGPPALLGDWTDEETGEVVSEDDGSEVILQ